MRIDKLYIKKFKNLKEFKVDFDDNSVKQVIVGRNGTGKSNLFEAIAKIFCDLDLKAQTDFEYTIEYLCKGNLIKIENKQSGEKNAAKSIGESQTFIKTIGIKRKGASASEEFEPLREKEFYSLNAFPATRLLPSYVFAYYSGIITRLKDVFRKHERRYYREQIEGEERPLRPLFLAKPHHSQFALLAFYASEDRKARQFLKNEFGILGIESVLFALREPFWYQKSASEQKREKGDPRFWYAAGKVRLFLEKLFDHSFAPMAAVDKVETQLDNFARKERRYCFVADQETLESLAEGLPPKEFFARMESMFYSDLIDEEGADVQINIRIKNSPESITFYDLSEGERQLITVLGLMRFTAEEEALFLLDEPDTHQNPAWCLDYLRNLKEYGAEPPNSQIIMTTHNPLTFAGLEKEEVVILEETEEGNIFSYHPSTAPKGMGVEAILTSEFFGLQAAMDKDTYEKLQKKRELEAQLQQKKLDPAGKRKLEELSKELEPLGYNRTEGDPLYQKFLNAIALRKEFKKPLLTKSELEEQNTIINSVLDDIMKEKH